MRQNLNYDWQFAPNFDESYIAARAAPGTRKVLLPHTMKTVPFNYFDEESLNFVGTYFKTFRLSIGQMNKAIRLRFEGVASSCEVYVNGVKAGEHRGAYTGFDIDITRLVIFDRDNTLMVKVDAREKQNFPPFGGKIDYLTYGGIYREVYLEITEPDYIDYALISPVNNRYIEVKYRLRRAVDLFQLRYKVRDDKGQIVCEGEKRYEDAERVALKQEIPQPHLWDIDDPYLYTLETELIIDHRVVDVKTERFGMREAKFTPQGFYLNGKRVQLIGLNRHQSYPYVGYAMPKSQQRLDAYLLKNYLHCNFARSSHYPQSRHFYDCLDEIGMLCMIEVPGWQHIGDAEWQKELIKTTEETIVQYYNHPSIVLFGTRVNESEDNHDLYAATAAKVREYDSQRAIGGVRDFAHSELLEDVYTYNDFSCDGKNAGVLKPKKVAGDNVPYLITEHNGHMHPTKRFDPTPNRVDQALRHARVVNDAGAYPQISGVVGWCFADYNTHKQFGSGDRVCYHGVLDMYRLPKYAAQFYRSQTDEEPILEVCANLAWGDVDKSLPQKVVVFSNVDYLKVYRGETEIGKFTPDKTHYDKLAHPPFIIPDLVGDALALGEGFSIEDADDMKALMLQAADTGVASLTLLQKNKMRQLLKKYDLSISAAEKLYLKYFASSDAKADYYKFVGYKNDVEVISKKVGVARDCKYRISISQPQFVEDGTYDVMKIDVFKVDQFGNTLDYANDVIKVNAFGAVENLGPTTAALSGGAVSFYVQSRGLRGLATIKVYANDILIREITTGVVKNEG